MANQLYTCLWFNGQTAEAAEFYCSLFEQSKIVAKNPIISKFELAGTTIKLLNGGALFSINPSISLFVRCETKQEVEKLWNAFMDGGKAMMNLDTYPWSEYYGWIVDKYGMTWQLFLAPLHEGEQKVIPSMLFTNEVYGRAEEAIRYYSSVFKESKIFFTDQYKDGEPQPAGKLKFGSFELNHAQFAAMDGPGNHAFQFNEGVSIVVECEDQAEIDYYWEQLSEGGHEGQCGWLKDKFGVSWQIVPIVLNQLMGNPATAEKARNAFMRMKKFIIQDLY
jgi:predicted 3-demethylubiquinone-9 3-methyltransferase (glyoxalase superfamily)